MLDRWNDIGNKLVAMAKDFPEDKYDFKLQKDQRTFALNLLHAAALDFVLIRRISGSNVGPDFGEGDNPSRDAFKTKADVVKFVQEAVADGAKVIQQQGDAGLDFFFQAEDGIRDLTLTGVQTCALPIFAANIRKAPRKSAMTCMFLVLSAAVSTLA